MILSPLQSGMKLKVIKTFSTIGWPRGYEIGDILYLVEPTGQSPYGFLSPLGNWLVKCPYHEKPTVWSSIWNMVDNRWVVIEE